MAAATSAWAKPGAWALESETQSSVENPSPDFPSLAAAAASKPSKKKKPQPQSLAQFTASSQPHPLNLPTGPRERSAEDLDRPSRSFYTHTHTRSSADETKRNSRADEASDWGSTKRSVVNKSGFFDSASRADEADSWVSKRGGEKAGFDGWGRKREEALAFRGERPRLVLQPRTVPVGGESGEGKGSSIFGLARPREEVLAEKGQDWKKMEERLEGGRGRERGGDEGRKGWGVGNGGLGEDRTGGSWRKGGGSDAVASMYGFFYFLLIYLLTVVAFLVACF